MIRPMATGQAQRMSCAQAPPAGSQAPSRRSSSRARSTPPDASDEQRREEAPDRQREVVPDGDHQRQEVDAEPRQTGEQRHGAVAERARNRHGEDAQRHRADGAPPRPAARVDEMRHGHLEQRDRGSQRRRRQQQEEGGAEQAAAGQGGKQLGQHDEDQLRPAAVGVEPRQRETGWEDDEAGQQGDPGVEGHDPQRRRRDTCLPGQIAAVREYAAHAEAEREERLAQRRVVDRCVEQAGQVRPEVVAEALRGARQGNRPHGEQDQQADERRHEGLGDPLDARPDAAEQDDRRHGQDEQRQQEAGGPIGGEVGEEHPGRLWIRGQTAAQAEPRIGDGPAGDDAVEGENARPGRDAQAAHEPPARTGGLQQGERADGRLLRAAPDRDLGDQDRQADERDVGQIDEHERRAAALSHTGRKAPDVAQTDRRAGGSQYESRTCAPTAPVRHDGCILPKVGCQPKRAVRQPAGRRAAGGSQRIECCASGLPAAPGENPASPRDAILTTPRTAGTRQDERARH